MISWVKTGLKSMNRRIENKYIKIVALFLATLLALAGGWYFYSSSQQQLKIYDFDMQRDAPFVRELFKNDWYLLVAGISDSFDEVAQEYVETMLRNRRSVTNRADLTLKVAYQKDKPVGFFAYFIKKFYLGKILFINVLPEYRSQGIGAQLMNYAMNELIKKGVSQIELLTRAHNYTAQALYKKLGFFETKRDDEFVNFAYQVPQ